ncbi:MAG: glycosyltransferase family 2 protein [Proteobacteria bacterium]|nr:glycosyltransferase family 2 protein [Pseudomonadota bacterium]
MSISLCAIVPSHNHHKHIRPVIDALRKENLGIYIIDDGSDETTRQALLDLHNPSEDIIVHRHEQNRGKGFAVIKGFKLAFSDGYSHALQIDADGQHDLTQLPELLKAATHNPSALISGEPIYDETIPTSRKIARWITHVWVWIETLSTGISDSMCGYRVYPLVSALEVVHEETVGQFMDFDTEIMVRMSWRGAPIQMIPIKVTYPSDNISNFQLLADNWRITKMHTRLVFAMLVRLPQVYRNRPRRRPDAKHWADLNERGVSWGVKAVFGTYKLLGRNACWILLQPILLYFFVTGRHQRTASFQYWNRIWTETGKAGKPGYLIVWRHYRSFGRMALEKLAAWLGDIGVEELVADNLDELDSVASGDKGVIVFSSHLGNIEVSRALARKRGANRVTVFAHTRNAMRFNRILAKYNPLSAIDIMEVEDITPATIIELQDRLDRGDWIVIAGDRIPITGEKRLTEVKFLGDQAPFSQGPVLIASLLKCPVYVMNCVREEKGFRVFFEKIAEEITLPRRGRDEAIQGFVTQYARILEDLCKKYPDQWYNLYDFWRAADK